MSTLVTKSIEKAAIGTIVSSSDETPQSGITCTVEVCRLAGRASYTALIDGKDKGVSRTSAALMWLWVMDYFSVWKVEELPKKEKKTRKAKIL